MARRPAGNRPRYMPVSEEMRDEIRRLHSMGYGRNEICQEMDLAYSVVSRHAADMGLAFNQVMHPDVAEGRKRDLARLRADLSHKMMLKANELVDEMDNEAVVYSFDKMGGFHKATLDKMPSGDIRNLMTAAAIALQRSLEVEKYDSGEVGVENAASVLDQIFAGIKDVIGKVDNGEVTVEEGTETPTAEDRT